MVGRLNPVPHKFRYCSAYSSSSSVVFHMALIMLPRKSSYAGAPAEDPLGSSEDTLKTLGARNSKGENCTNIIAAATCSKYSSTSISASAKCVKKNDFQQLRPELHCRAAKRDSGEPGRNYPRRFPSGFAGAGGAFSSPWAPARRL